MKHFTQKLFKLAAKFMSHSQWCQIILTFTRTHSWQNKKELISNGPKSHASCILQSVESRASCGDPPSRASCGDPPVSSFILHYFVTQTFYFLDEVGLEGLCALEKRRLARIVVTAIVEDLRHVSDKFA